MNVEQFLVALAIIRATHNRDPQALVCMMPEVDADTRDLIRNLAGIAAIVLGELVTRNDCTFEHTMDDMVSRTVRLAAS